MSEESPAPIRKFHAHNWLIAIKALVAWASNTTDPASTRAGEQDFPDDTPLKYTDDLWVQEGRDR